EHRQTSAGTVARCRGASPHEESNGRPSPIRQPGCTAQPADVAALPIPAISPEMVSRPGTASGRRSTPSQTSADHEPTDGPERDNDGDRPASPGHSVREVQPVVGTEVPRPGGPSMTGGGERQLRDRGSRTIP